MRQLGIADYELWRDRNAYRTLKSREQQNESLQPEATDKSLSCSTGDHLVDVRGKFAQAAPHDLFEIQASSLLSRTQKLFFRDSSRGSYLILITSTHNKWIILILWKVKKKITAPSKNYADKFLPKGNQSSHLQGRAVCQAVWRKLVQQNIYLPFDWFKAVWAFYLPNIWVKCVKEKPV